MGKVTGFHEKVLKKTPEGAFTKATVLEATKRTDRALAGGDGVAQVIQTPSMSEEQLRGIEAKTQAIAAGITPRVDSSSTVIPAQEQGSADVDLSTSDNTVRRKAGFRRDSGIRI